MIRLRAAALDDGWAFVETDDQIVIAKPPYLRDDLIPVGEEDLQRAVGTHGFETFDQDFQSWKTLIAFLDAEFVSRCKAINWLPADSGSELFEFADLDVLSIYVQRIESDLIDKGRLGEAMRVLSLFVKLPTLKEDSRLLDFVIDLLARCSRESAARHSFQQILTTSGFALSAFDTAVKKHGVPALRAFCSAVVSRGQILPMCE